VAQSARREVLSSVANCAQKPHAVRYAVWLAMEGRCLVAGGGSLGGGRARFRVSGIRMLGVGLGVWGEYGSPVPSASPRRGCVAGRAVESAGGVVTFVSGAHNGPVDTRRLVLTGFAVVRGSL